jgi:predicted phage terminase large subunit-like protein
VILDEAAMARHLEEAWNAAIRPTLTDLAGDAWFLSTPKGLNYFHTLYQRGGVEEGWAAWQMPTASNPYIPAEEIEAARKELPSLVFQQEYLAQFVTFEGTAVRREWLKVAAAPPNCRRFVMGVDLAISTKTSADWTAAIVMTMDDSGRLYLVAAERTRAPFNEILAFVAALADRWHPVQIGIEDVQFQAAVVQELLRTTSLPVRGVRPDRDKLTRFQPVAARYEQGLIYHDPGLPTAFENELLAFPQGEHDDWVDALAYAFNLLRAGPFEYSTGARDNDWRGRRGY